MNKEKLREDIVDMFGNQFFDTEWESIKEGNHPIVSMKDVKWLREVTDQILALLEHGKLIELDENQDLPEHGLTESPEGFNPNYDAHDGYIDGWNECKENMFNANFRRIKQPEATDKKESEAKK